MENNIRRDQKVQNTLYELSYGSNTPKKRFGLTQLAIFILLFGISTTSPIWVPMIITLGLFLYYQVPKNERRTENEPKTELIPSYNANAIDIICMLRNAEVEKRGR